MHRKFLVFDTETEAFAPAPEAPPPRFAAMGWLADGDYHSTQDHALGQRVLREALARGYVLIGHNLAFDLEVMFTRPQRDDSLWCTMIADVLWRLERNDCERGGTMFRALDAVLGRRLAGKESTRVGFVPGRALTDEQAAYLRSDVEATRTVFFRQWSQLGPGRLRLLNLEVRAQLALRAIERTGLLVDERERLAQRIMHTKTKHRAARVLQQFGLYTPKRPKKRAAGEHKAKLHHKIMQELLEQWCTSENIPAKRTGKTKKVSTDREFLQQFQSHPEVHAWLEYRNAEKMISTYLDKWSTPSGRVFARYNLMVRTDRTSCAKPNLQNVPSRGRRGEIKRIFVAPPEHSFFELDYHQGELCCLAHLTKGELKRLINEDRDIHKWLASKYFRKPSEHVDKAERQLMKACNFGLPGGMGPAKFRSWIRANGLPDPGERGAADLINTWLATFPEMSDWLHDPNRVSWATRQIWSGTAEEHGAEADERTLAEAWNEAARRMRSIPKALQQDVEDGVGSPRLARWLEGRSVETKAGLRRYPVTYTEQRNTRFQGLLAALTKDALGCILVDRPELCQVHAFVHDSILISVPRGGEERVLEAGEIMLDAAARWLPDILVKVDICGPGDNWYETKSREFRTLSRVPKTEEDTQSAGTACRGRGAE